MTREGMYRLIQACVEGDIDYVTEEGISIIQRGEHGTNQLSPVLDALMDRYLDGAGRDMQLSVRSLATASGVGPDETVRALLALTDVYLVSNHIEERLLTVRHIELDSSKRMTVHVTLCAWLAFHLEMVREAAQLRVGT